MAVTEVFTFYSLSFFAVSVSIVPFICLCSSSFSTTLRFFCFRKKGCVHQTVASVECRKEESLKRSRFQFLFSLKVWVLHVVCQYKVLWIYPERRSEIRNGNQYYQRDIIVYVIIIFICNKMHWGSTRLLLQIMIWFSSVILNKSIYSTNNLIWKFYIEF